MESIRQPEAVHTKKRKLIDNGRTRIEVQIPRRPKGYVPGSGPPLQPIRLLPPRDTTAYILDRIILPSPGPAADGMPLPRRMTYIVGWHDLPAARMLVPAMQILNFVSPQEVEDWGFNNMEEQMDRKKVEEKEKQQAEETSAKPKRRGRPPKHSKIESAVVTEPEGKTAAIPKKGVMTISLPKENRLAQFEGLSDEDGTPSRQLQQEMSRGSTDVDMDHESEEVDLVPQRPQDVRSVAQLGSLHTTGLEPRAPGQSHAASKLAFELASSSSSATSTRQSTPKPATSNSDLKGKNKMAPATFSNKTEKPAPVVGDKDGIFSGPEWKWAPFEEVALPYSIPEPMTERPEPQADRIPPISEVNSTQTKPKEKKAAPKPSEPVPATEKPAEGKEDGAEPVWEVKRLEGMEFFEVEGSGVVRFFNVRWEGDWPPDQNPSWEPEDNLPTKLVRNYLKQSKKRRIGHEEHRLNQKIPRPQTTQAPSAPPAPKRKKGPLKQTKLSWGIPTGQYKSVSEAFAGDEEELMGVGIVDDGPDEAEEEEDELFVVEEPPAKRSRVQAPWNGTSARMDISTMPVFR